ncbi:MAG TPA: hypothetical protein VGS07_10745 [Thermoanaerobaculia bacterium]|jgi:hypothetical protein|nr:hypothetical protein [Thermoanaerobaculia bacterium]
MSDEAQSNSAFSKEYRAILRARDEPDTPWAGDALKPVVILSTQGGFGLFRPWQNPEAGDVPLAVFADLADARLAAVAHSVIRRTRHYKLREPATPLAANGYAVFRDGDAHGWLQAFDPEWIEAMNVLIWIAQYAEGLAVMLDLAGPTIQGELGEILGRSFAALFHPGVLGDVVDEVTRPEPVRPVPPGDEGDHDS